MFESLPVCDCSELHPSAVERARRSMPDAELLDGLTNFFKVLGDKTRTGNSVRFGRQRAVRLRPCRTAGYDKISHIPSAGISQKRQAGQIQERRQKRVLFSGRRPRAVRCGNGCGAFES